MLYFVQLWGNIQAEQQPGEEKLQRTYPAGTKQTAINFDLRTRPFFIEQSQRG